MGWVEADDALGNVDRRQPGAVDQAPAGQAHRLGAAHVQTEAGLDHPRREQRRAQYQRRPRCLGVTQQGQHQAVGVNDAGGRRPQRGDARQRRLQRSRLGGIEPLQVIHAVAPALLQQTLQAFDLGRIGGDDQFAEALVFHAVTVAIGIQPLLALDAQLRLEAPIRVVEAGVNHLGVARADPDANPRARLHHQHLMTGLGQGTRHCQADHAGPDHHTLDIDAHPHLACRKG